MLAANKISSRRKAIKKSKKVSLPLPRFVSTRDIAKRLRLTPRRIRQLVASGLPHVGRGRHDVDAVLDWYVAYLKRRLARESDEEADANRRKHELRDLAARADLREIELAMKREELVSIADVENQMTYLVVSTRARILTVPARVSGELVCEQSRTMAQAKVEKALEDALFPLIEFAESPGLWVRTLARPGR